MTDARAVGQVSYDVEVKTVCALCVCVPVSGRRPIVTVTWWYILVVAQSNGLNLPSTACRGVNSHTHTARCPTPRTHSGHTERKTAERRGSHGAKSGEESFGFYLNLRVKKYRKKN